MGTSYVEVAHKFLRPTVEHLQLKCDIRGVENLGSWAKNTGFKPYFILQMLSLHKENIVFLDSDAEVLQYPNLFDSVPPEFNFACHILDRNKWYNVQFNDTESHELLSGTLFVRNCPESIRIVEEWNLSCKISNLWEQKVLAAVLKKNNVSVYELPLSYCYIKTMPNGDEPFIKCDNPVIVHNQVSRVLKNTIN